MQHLNNPTEIKIQIQKFASTKILWLDTEIADWDTYYPRLSLIQVLTNPTDTKEDAYILDVLDEPDLIAFFIDKIMINSQIEKVFHNASFDLKYLGGEFALNVTCTLKIARKISRKILQVSNLKLKTLAIELCKFSDVDIEEQASDWGKRPLSEKQLKYAAMDTVYLAAVHRHLLEHSNYVAINSASTLVKSLVEESREVEEHSSRGTFKMERELIKGHKDLKVYQMAFDVAMKIFEASKKSPLDERYLLTDQIRGSSRSVCVNLAEAWRKRRYEDAFILKLNECEALSAETQTWIEFAVKCDYLDVDTGRELYGTYNRILGGLVNMINNPSPWLMKD